MGADHWAAMMAILEQPDTPAAADVRATMRRNRARHYGSRLAAAVDTTPTVEDIDLSTVRWQDRAACNGADVEAFFRPGLPTVAVRQMCASCPVLDECLQYALDRPYVVGVWAGTNDAQRRRLRKAAG